MKGKNLKSNKAITLVALVITIIILLILAMVNIKLVFQDGIIKTTEKAVNAYNATQINELEQLNEVENGMSKYEAGDWWKIKPEEKEVLKAHTEGESATIAIVSREDEKTFTQLSAVMESDNEVAILLLMKVKEEIYEFYFMPITDIGIEAIKADDEYWSNTQGENPNKDYQKLKWYKSMEASHFYKGEAYTGPALISSSEVKEGEVFCQSYFDRIVRYSF